VGILSWSQFEKTIGWSNFFVLGASLSLTQALISTGAATWFAQGLLDLLAGSSASWPQLALFLVLATTVVHLGIPNMSACIALLIPVVAAFANATGVDPVAAGLIVGFVVDAVVLYPV
jgi:sodium-dependent dicarboxylate transporter 2/3/5